MIIDCRGRYTTAPTQPERFRERQVVGLKDAAHVPADDREKMFHRSVHRVYPRFGRAP